MENLWPYFEVLAPSLGVGLIFWFAMRSIFRADRNERVAETQIRQEHAEAQPPSAEAPGPGSETERTSTTESDSSRTARS